MEPLEPPLDPPLLFTRQQWNTLDGIYSGVSTTV